MRLPRPSLPQVAVIVFLGAILLSETLLYAPPVQERLSFGIQLSYAGGYVDESDRVSSTFTASLVRSNLVTGPFAPVTTIYFYYDAAYPSSWSSPPNWYGLSQHLEAVASQRGGSLSLIYVNASQLQWMLELPPAPGSALLVASGVLPCTVFTKTQNLVTPWLREGGTLIWAGDKIGTFSGQPNQPLKYPSPANPGPAGTGQFVPLLDFGSSSSWFLNQSADSEALGLNYSYGEPADDLNVTSVASGGGVALGPQAQGFTNLAAFPEGRGRLVYFGAPVTAALDQLSEVVLNGLTSGAFLGNFTLLSSHPFVIEAGHSATFSESLDVRLWALGGTSPSQDCAFVYQSDFVGFFATEKCLVLPHE